MTPLEIAELQKQEVLDEIDELKEELAELQELISQLAAEESDNPYWTEPDELGARLLKPMQDIKNKFLKSTKRAEYCYAGLAGHSWNRKGIFASLTEEVDPQYLKWYSEAQTRNFAFAMIGGGMKIARVKGEDGNWIEGYGIPWWGNYGPHGTTMRLQDEWSRPGKLAQMQARAERWLRMMDRRWDREGRMRGGDPDAFRAKHPTYIPESEWYGNPEA